MKLDEIAALAGVSRTTASYVINGKADQYRISQATRDKVMAVVHAHNYQPDSRAASCAAARPGPWASSCRTLRMPAMPSSPSASSRARELRAISC